MKRVVCSQCQKSWAIEKDDLDSLQVCPFCGMPLWKNAKPENLSSLQDALVYLIDRNGPQIFSTPERIIRILADLIPDKRQEIKFISKVLQNEYSSILINFFTGNEQEAQLRRLRRILITEEFIIEQKADELIEILRQVYLKNNSPSLVFCADLEELKIISENPFEIQRILELAKSLVEKKPEESIKLYQKAVNLGWAPAFKLIGDLYFYYGYLKPAHALNWYKKAVECGANDLDYELGILYKNHVCPRDDDSAFRYLKKAISNRSEALLPLAELYASGRGIEKDTLQAALLAYQALEKNIPNAEQMLSVYTRQMNTEEKSQYYLLTKQIDPIDQHFMHAADLEKQAKYLESLDEYLDLFKKGYKKSAERIGDLYNYRLNNKEKALEWYRKADDLGILTKFYELAKLYDSNKTLDPTGKKVRELYEKALASGDERAREPLERMKLAYFQLDPIEGQNRLIQARIYEAEGYPKLAFSILQDLVANSYKPAQKEYEVLKKKLFRK